MVKNVALMKQGGETAANRKQVNFRIPNGMFDQISMMAAERGQDMTTVLVDLLERGLMRESVGEFAQLTKERFKEIQTDNQLMSDVMGDFSDQLKLMNERLASIESAAKK